MAHTLPPPAGLLPGEVVLDIGAGLRPMQWYRPRRHICVEPYAPYAWMLARAAEYEVWPLRARDALTYARRYEQEPIEAIYLLDVIEHMKKPTGMRVLELALGLAMRQVVVYTPQGFVAQTGDAWELGGERWQRHRSGWRPEDFPAPWVTHVPTFVTDEGQEVQEGFFALWTNPGESMRMGLEYRVAAILGRIAHLESPEGVEVGVATGEMSFALLQGHPGLHLLMVDSWLAVEQQPAAYIASSDPHAKLSAAEQQEFAKAAELRTEDFVARRQILHLDSVQAANTIPDGNCDFVFLDADHSIEGVRADLKAWWPKIRPGGWLCGHDYGGWICAGESRRYFGVQRAVDAAAREQGWVVERDEDYTWFVQRSAA